MKITQFITNAGIEIVGEIVDRPAGVTPVFGAKSIYMKNPIKISELHFDDGTFDIMSPVLALSVSTKEEIITEINVDTIIIVLDKPHDKILKNYIMSIEQQQEHRDAADASSDENDGLEPLDKALSKTKKRVAEGNVIKFKKDE